MSCLVTLNLSASDTLHKLSSLSSAGFKMEYKAKKPVGPELMNSLTWGGKLDSGVMCDPILDFLGDFMMENSALMKQLHSSRMEAKFDIVKEHLKKYVEEREDDKNELKKLLKVDKLLFPCLELDVPLVDISEYNQMDEDDPRVFFYRSDYLFDGQLREFGCMVDRYDCVKEAICRLVWSTIDKAVMIMPDIGLNPYPTCWHCDKQFGTARCGKCLVARYCGKGCQAAHWHIEHKRRCPILIRELSRVTVLEY